MLIKKGNKGGYGCFVYGEIKLNFKLLKLIFQEQEGKIFTNIVLYRTNLFYNKMLIQYFKRITIKPTKCFI